MKYNRKGLKSYSMSASQQIIEFQTRFCFNKNVSQISFYMITEKKIDFELMKKAIEEEIRRNDCMRIGFFKEKGVTKQYFMPEYTLKNIPVYEFENEAEQDKVLQKDAQKPVRINRGGLYRILLFKTGEKKYGVYLNVHHMIMDATAVNIFFKDVCRVYDAMESGSPMPKPLASYEDILQKEFALQLDEVERGKDEEYFRSVYKEGGEPHYAGAQGKQYLDEIRRKRRNPNCNSVSIFNPFNENSKKVKATIASELMNRVRELCSSENVSMSAVLQIAMRIYLSIINETNDVMVQELCCRRITNADRNSGGCRTHSLSSRFIFDDSMSLKETIHNFQIMQMQLLRHSNYSTVRDLDMIREIYTFPMTDSYHACIFTYMPKANINSDNDTWRCSYSGYDSGKFSFPLYIYMHEDVVSDVLHCYYEYRTKMMTQKNIEDLHKYTVSALEAIVENPELTIGEIKKKIVIS